MSLEHLHILLQSVMGWNDTHMYAFTIKGDRFILGERDFAVDSMWATKDGYDAANYELCQLIKPGMAFHYEYDFGDGWEHEIVVETDKTSTNTKHCYYCVEGERACPPEDCGGIGGYEDLLEILATPEHPEYEERIEWLERLGYPRGRFDSEKFDPDVCNRELEVRRPGQLDGSKTKKADLEKKQERKRKEAAKKRNRK